MTKNETLRRCQQKVLRRKLRLISLGLALETAREIEDIYWEQVEKLTSPEIKAEFKKYARRFTRERKALEKAIRSRGCLV